MGTIIISSADSNFCIEPILDPIKMGCQVRHPSSHRDTSEVHFHFFHMHVHLICSFTLQMFVFGITN